MATPAKKINILSNSDRDKDNNADTNNRLKMADQKIKRSHSPERLALSDAGSQQMRKLMEQRWKHVVLKDECVTDWKLFLECCETFGTVSLDITGVKIPEKANIPLYWSRFCTYLKVLKTLKVLTLWKCPIRTVNAAISLLPELEVLIATSIQNYDSKTKYAMPINFEGLSEMTKLTEIRIKSFCELNIVSMKPFDKLVNLKILSLTSIVWYPRNIYALLSTVTTNLEILELGDCCRFSEEIVAVISRLKNLRSLRLENCNDRWDNFSLRAFKVIGELKNLNTLELINISFTKSVKYGLMLCRNIKQLLITPIYSDDPGETVRLVAECLQSMAATLKYVLWILTTDMMLSADVYVSKYTNVLDGGDLRPPRVFAEDFPRLTPMYKRRSTVVYQSNQLVNFDAFPFENFANLMRGLIGGGMRYDLVMEPFEETTFINLAQLVYKPPA